MCSQDDFMLNEVRGSSSQDNFMSKEETKAVQ